MSVLGHDITNYGFTINTCTVFVNGRMVFETAVRHSLFRNGMWIVLGHMPNDEVLALQFHDRIVELFEKNGQHIHRLRDFVNGKTYVRQKEMAAKCQKKGW